MAVAILRLQEGLDYSNILKDGETMVSEVSEVNGPTSNSKQSAITRNASFSQISQGNITYS